MRELHEVATSVGAAANEQCANCVPWDLQPSGLGSDYLHPRLLQSCSKLLQAAGWAHRPAISDLDIMPFELDE